MPRAKPDKGRKKTTRSTHSPGLRQSYDNMVREVKIGKDPWAGHGRGREGYAAYYRTKLGCTEADAYELAERLLALMGSSQHDCR